MNRKFQYYIDLILVLIQKELKVRYKSSILGYLWSVAHPLAFAVVFYVAFKVIVKIPVENYALFPHMRTVSMAMVCQFCECCANDFPGECPTHQEGKFSEKSYSIYPCPAGHDAFCSRYPCSYPFSFFRGQDTESCCGLLVSQS